MTRLEKELTNKGIIGDWQDYYGGYETERQLVCIENGIIIIIEYSNVVDPVFQLYNARTLELIGWQDRYFDWDIFSHKWKRYSGIYAD